MFLILLIVLVIVVLIVAAPMAPRRKLSRDRRNDEPIPHRRAFKILDERLASGEIAKSEYDEMRRTIAQSR